MSHVDPSHILAAGKIEFCWTRVEIEKRISLLHFVFYSIINRGYDTGPLASIQFKHSGQFYGRGGGKGVRIFIKLLTNYLRSFLKRHDTQHNGIQHNTKNNNKKCNTQHILGSA